MIRTTGGRAFGATSTRSRPWLSATASASSTDMMPSWTPSAPMTRTGLIRICRFTRTFFSVAIVPPLRVANKKGPAPTGPFQHRALQPADAGQRRSLLNPAVPRMRTEGWGGWMALPLPVLDNAQYYVPARAMSSRQCPRLHRLPHHLNELRPGHDLLLAPRAPSPHGHRPGLHLPLPEDGHVRDRLHLRVADPVPERLRPGIQRGAQAGPAQLLDELLPRGPEFVRDGEHAHLLGREPRRERAAVMLEQPAHEALHGSQERTVDHHRPVR